MASGQAVSDRDLRDPVAVRLGLVGLRSWPAPRWLVAVLVAVLAALAMGVPTGIVETSSYTRMTPVTWWSYPVWAVSAVSAVLGGLSLALLATGLVVRLGGAVPCRVAATP